MHRDTLSDLEARVLAATIRCYHGHPTVHYRDIQAAVATDGLPRPRSVSRALSTLVTARLVLRSLPTLENAPAGRLYAPGPRAKQALEHKAKGRLELDNIILYAIQDTQTSCQVW